MPRKYQNGKLFKRADVKRPYWFIRVTKPRIVGGTRIKARVDVKLGFCDEVTRDKALKLRAQELDRIGVGTAAISMKPRRRVRAIRLY